MVNTPLQKQINELKKILQKNKHITKILDNNPFSNNISWYLGAGCICQSVWNHSSGKKITNGIKDYDLIYYDAKDTSYETEGVLIQKGIKLYDKLPVEVEIRNQARVHLWFEKHFGHKINQLKSCENAINGWPTTATAVGVNKVRGNISIYAPYGLNDLFSMTIRPNKPFVTKEVYEKKADGWLKEWPDLRVIPWKQI